MDQRQLEWFEKEISSSNSPWKIVFFHHPLYSSGRKHGPDIELRGVLEPLLVKHGVGGTYSSIAIASPVVLESERSHARNHEHTAVVV